MNNNRYRHFQCICGREYVALPATAYHRDYLCEKCFREERQMKKELERRKKLENAQWGRKRYKLITTENWGWSQAAFGWDEVTYMLRWNCFDIGDKIECNGTVFEVREGASKQKLVKLSP